MLGSGVVDSLDPVVTVELEGVLPLTNDGLTAYQQVGGSGSVQLVPDLAVSLPVPDRWRHYVHVPAAARDPLLGR